MFDFLVAEKIISSSPAFDRYLANPALQTAVGAHLLVQDRISLATLAGPLPNDMSHRTMLNMLHEMRHRFRSAIDQLRDIDVETLSSTAREAM